MTISQDANFQRRPELCLPFTSECENSNRLTVFLVSGYFSRHIVQGGIAGQEHFLHRHIRRPAIEIVRMRCYLEALCLTTKKMFPTLACGRAGMA
jgi:hypothetical protein